jgi:hypothetical protein
VNDPVLSRVTTRGFATIVASPSSIRRLDAVKTTVPEAPDPVPFKYCPTTVLVFTSGEKLIRSTPGHKTVGRNLPGNKFLYRFIFYATLGGYDYGI